MDAIIKRKLLQEAFGQGQMSRDGINFTVSCPFCGESNKKKFKLAIRLDDHRYHCWVCEKKGKNIWQLVAIKRPDLINKIPVDRSSLSNFLSQDHSLLEKRPSNLELPTGIVPLWRTVSNPDAKACMRYLASRGLEEEDIIRWRLLAGTSGQFRRHVVFPSFDEKGELNYYIGRAIDETTFRYRNAVIPKTEVIFNDVDVDWESTIILTEGVFDAVKCPDNAVPILGSNLPKNSKLYRKLIENSCNVIIAFDSDLPKKAYHIASNLASDNCDVRICFPPPGKDLGSMTKEEVRSLLQSAKVFDEYSLLNFKINNIRSGSII